MAKDLLNEAQSVDGQEPGWVHRRSLVWLTFIVAITMSLIAGSTAVSSPPASPSARLGNLDLRHNDSVGDVYRLGATGRYFPAPDRVNGDMQAVVVRHSERLLLISAQYRVLDVDGQWFLAHSLITTDEGSWMPQMWWWKRGRDGNNCRESPAIASCWEWNWYLEDLVETGDAANCQNFQAVLDWRRNMVQFQVPLTCIGDPTRVRINFWSTMATWRGDFQDQGFREGAPGRSTSSPWINLA